jgi:hypothetical protein
MTIRTFWNILLKILGFNPACGTLVTLVTLSLLSQKSPKSQKKIQKLTKTTPF